MFRALSIAAALAVSSASGATAQEPQDEPAPVEVMVFGTYHWANPGQDAVNMEVDDVLAAKRQREIEILAATLAQWQPTRIMVERQADAPDFEIDDYARTDELLRTSRNESVQLGFRMARMLGHEAVYGFDEQPSEGEPDYFPMGRVQATAAETGQSGVIEGLIADLQARTDAEQERLAQQSLAESLLFHNDPDVVGAEHDKLYYTLIRIGDGEAQPGAELNAYWYMRNAKMFGKLDMVAEPGDRVLVIVGSGHATWLKHFARRMPGYVNVEPMPYLIGAAAASEVAE